MATDAKKVHLHTQLRWIYMISLIVWTLTWLVVGYIFVRKHNVRHFSILSLGFLVGLALIVLNMGMISKETVSSAEEEQSQEELVQRNSFYVLASMFAFGSILTQLQRDTVQAVLPLLMAIYFFLIVIVMYPVWVSTENPRAPIFVKHIKTQFMAYSLGCLTSVLSIVTFTVLT